MPIIALLPLIERLSTLAIGYLWPTEKGGRIAEMIAEATQLARLDPGSPQFYESLIELSAAGASLAFDDPRGVQIANLIGTLGEVAATEYKEELARQGKTITQLHEHARQVFLSESDELARSIAKTRRKIAEQNAQATPTRRLVSVRSS